MITVFIAGTVFGFFICTILTTGKVSRCQDEAELWRERCQAAEYEAEAQP